MNYPDYFMIVSDIEGDAKAELLSCIEQCNRESGLHIQLITNEPQAFNGFMAHYGKFSSVTNYIAMIGKKDSDLLIPYYCAIFSSQNATA